MSARLVVRGLDGSGCVCVEFGLEHGSDPRTSLLALGWRAVELIAVTGPHGDDPIVADFRVRRAAPQVPVQPRPVRREVSEQDAVGAAVRQRISAYAVISSDRGLLLTEASARTSVPGTWGLPGGGLDPGEEPGAAALRETWEETGQHVRLLHPVDVLTQHWIGRAPDGRVEDFHAVRVVYSGRCDHPTDPVVHDVGGTTESAAWVAHRDLPGRTLTPWAGALLCEPGD